MFHNKKIFLGLFLLASSIIDGSVVEISSKNFNSQIIQNSKPVILDVYATWCGPCTRMKPIFADTAEKFNGQVLFAKMDCDKEPALTEQLGIDSFPTFIIFKNGKKVKTIVGSRSKKELTSLINKYT